MIQPTQRAVQRFLAGRIWHLEHLPFPKEDIQTLIAKQQITILPGVTSSRKRMGPSNYFCHRCLQREVFTIFDCARCNGPCVYCRNCLTMGRVSTCTNLCIWTGKPLQFQTQHTMHWHSQLTTAQQRASLQLISSTTRNTSHLLFAVCGAGKTEVLFEPIYHSLQQGKRVCVACPRVDVILELEPRFQEAFPTTSIEALYGGKTPIVTDAQLILATTHQLYRFQDAFDVIFIDEADAFPFSTDVSLQQAVNKAAKRGAPIHMVTATPSKTAIRKAKQRQAISLIPQRYHGHPLPVPTFTPLWRYQSHINKKKIPKKLSKWIQSCLVKNQPFLIFFHDITLMQKALPLIQQFDERIESVHAEDPLRKQHVLNLRSGQLKGLLTTTILERGITIPNVQVAVVGAEQKIFQAGALIQIGGRVGRAKDFPDGDFRLFHHGISTAMCEAKRTIERLNEGRI